MRERGGINEGGMIIFADDTFFRPSANALRAYRVMEALYCGGFIGLLFGLLPISFFYAIFSPWVDLAKSFGPDDYFLGVEFIGFIVTFDIWLPSHKNHTHISDLEWKISSLIWIALMMATVIVRACRYAGYITFPFQI